MSVSLRWPKDISSIKNAMACTLGYKIAVINAYLRYHCFVTNPFDLITEHSYTVTLCLCSQILTVLQLFLMMLMSVNSFSTRLLFSCTDEYVHTYNISTY